jgi:hypothetical protein
VARDYVDFKEAEARIVVLVSSTTLIIIFYGRYYISLLGLRLGIGFKVWFILTNDTLV